MRPFRHGYSCRNCLRFPADSANGPKCTETTCFPTPSQLGLARPMRDFWLISAVRPRRRSQSVCLCYRFGPFVSSGRFCGLTQHRGDDGEPNGFGPVRDCMIRVQGTGDDEVVRHAHCADHVDAAVGQRAVILPAGAHIRRSRAGDGPRAARRSIGTGAYPCRGCGSAGHCRYRTCTGCNPSQSSPATPLVIAALAQQYAVGALLHPIT